eukprot:3050950-Prymnesium_polylepis.1
MGPAAAAPPPPPAPPPPTHLTCATARRLPLPSAVEHHSQLEAIIAKAELVEWSDDQANAVADCA